MKRIFLLGAALVLTLGLLPATAGAGTSTAATGMVTIVHDATYDVGEPFPVTLCVDGEPFAGGAGQEPFVWGDVLGPVDLPAASYEIAIYGGAVEVCEGEPAIGPETLMVDAGDDITAAAIWTSAGPALTVWANDSSCYEPATSSRLTVRHGADTGGEPVDVVGLIDGVETTIISGLVEGGQETVDIPGGLTVTDAAVVISGTDTVAIALGDQTFDAGNQYVVYAGGGADGDAGVFVDVIPMDPCEVPVVPTTPTTAAPAAAAVTAAPAFTG